jgi:hypothetical protein
MFFANKQLMQASAAGACRGRKQERGAGTAPEKRKPLPQDKGFSSGITRFAH